MSGGHSNGQNYVQKDELNGREARVRPATVADLESILALERATEGAPHWAATAYTALLLPPGQTEQPGPSSQPTQAGMRRCLFVAGEEGAVVGFAVGMLSPVGTAAMRPAAELESVVVAERSRRSGLGLALCRAVFAWCAEQRATTVTLEVRSANLAALTLYRRVGFVEAGRRPRYYSNPADDALVLRLELQP